MQIALAPMEGLVDNILRDVLTRVGGIDWCVTEFIRVNDRLLTPAYFHKLAPELLHGAHTAAGVPLRVQLLGSDPVCLAENAALACELGSEVIDLNFGCPAKTVNKSRGGAVLLKEPELKSLDVSVETLRGEVLLSGFVKDQAQREKAMKAAVAVNGVTAVKDALVVR